MKIRKVFIAALSVLSGLFSCPLLVFGQQTTLPKDKQHGAILHAFCWSFQTIKDNMKQIADAGFTMVQTSPANKCFVGDDGGLEIFGKGNGIIIISRWNGLSGTISWGRKPILLP